jgi:predicted Zn-dependent protease
VNQMANKVAPNSDLKTPVVTKIIDSPQFDACSLPGGSLRMTGLLRNLDDEAQLATVVAHEIAHLAARHGANHVTRRVAIDTVGLLPLGMTYAIATSVPQASLPFALAKSGRGQEGLSGILCVKGSWETSTLFEYRKGNSEKVKSTDRMELLSNSSGERNCS